MAEADAELVAGFHTEYSSMRFAMFFMGEYVAMVVGSALIVTLFLGGWQFPGIGYLIGLNQWIGLFCGFMAFMVKLFIVLWLYYWTRWSLPRFRYDQITRLCWKYLFPIGLANVALTGIVLLIIQKI
jgi:NADH-quinone oxidoreductase subunit H